MSASRSAIAFAVLLLGACDETATADADAAPPAAAGKADGIEDGGELEPVEFYPVGQLHSPLTPTVARTLASVAASGLGGEDVFISVGDSITVSGGNLRCFAEDDVDLGEFDSLSTTLQRFRADGGRDPFARDSLAARVGKTAAWALRGTPSPLERELSAMEPSLALVQYGTNDMQFGSTFASAMPGFYTSMGDLLDVLLDDGVVPIMFTIPPRVDRADAASWVPMYNLVIRGLAQSRHLPLVDLNLALSEIPGHGLVGDGVHLNRAPSGACDLSAEGLAYAYNNRNAAALMALERVSRVLDTEDALDEPMLRAGLGTADDPFVIDSLPFVDAGDTTVRGEANVDRYDCASADEGGAEVWYRLELDEPTSVRIMVVDDPATDVDVHVVGEARDGSGCVARHDRLLELELGAGVHHIAVDTFVSGGVPRDGEFLLMLAQR